MLFNSIKLFSTVIVLGFIFVACSNDDSGAETTQQTITPKQTEMTLSQVEIAASDSGRVELENGIIYQEAIYKDWPYTALPVAIVLEETTEEEIPVVENPVAENIIAADPQTHVINAEARIFNPDIIYINPGDTVQWKNMTSHNTVSVEGLILQGAAHWRSSLGENLKVTLNKAGIYAYVCEPHIGFGMVGVIVVGKPTNLDEVMAYATTHLEGPYRRLLGKLKKVEIPQ